jgi:hypothetical protein
MSSATAAYSFPRESDKWMVLQLGPRWAAFLQSQPESGMAYQMLTIVLNDGRRFERVPYCADMIDLTGLTGYWKAPFSVPEISAVIVTHDRSGPPQLAR